MKLRCPGFEEFLGRGVDTAVRDPESFRGKRVLLVGGGDSAVDWAMALKDLAEDLLLIHRRDAFRAHEKSVADLHVAADAGTLTIRAFHEVKEIRGAERVESAVIFDNRTGEEEELQVDEVLTFLGFKPDLGPMNEWGLELAGNRVVVGRLMETSLPGVFAAGDMVDYEGKLDLIATGFAEAATAVNSAVHFVDPKARSSAGHSTNLRIFKNNREQTYER
jgi:thioredoxin reductase (NADPH)